MKLKFSGRVNLLSLAAIAGLLVLLMLSLSTLSTRMKDGIGDRTRRTVESAHSVILHFHAQERSGAMSRESAQAAALQVLSSMRYGKDDYFWVNDMHPRMLMHPFKPEMVGTDVGGNTDADGVLMFQEMVSVVRAEGEGFVDYRWSKPGEEEPAPKISYVKGFAPWGWIVGSGVYVDEVEAAVWSATLSQGGMALAVILAVGALSWLLGRSITRPVTALTARMRSLAAGDIDSPIPGRGRSDEAGEMAQALQVFRDAAEAKARAEEEKAKADAEQKFVVDTISANLESLSKGDLTAEVTAAFPPSYAVLKDNFNSALAQLRALIGAVSASAQSIRAGSREIAQASDDLARRTESNAASLEETAAALDQIEGRVRSTASAAGTTAQRTEQAASDVRTGRSRTDHAVSAMGRVSESAQGIDSVIEGLDKIAFQTRVLAMNAAVEAGRAGEAGRGFAVVADLVSALAMRSEEEAKRAREQLTATQTDISTAVEAVEQVDSALSSISSSVEDVHRLVAAMASDNQAQSTAMTEISAAVRTMDQSTQQNAAMVEETSAAARTLASEVGTLAEHASRFRTEGGKPAPHRALQAAA